MSKKKILALIKIISDVAVIAAFILSLTGKISVSFAIGLYFLSDAINSFHKWADKKYVPYCQITGSIIMIVSALALTTVPKFQAVICLVGLALIAVSIILNLLRVLNKVCEDTDKKEKDEEV